jgi:hypothetical protein
MFLFCKILHFQKIQNTFKVEVLYICLINNNNKFEDQSLHNRLGWHATDSKAVDQVEIVNVPRSTTPIIRHLSLLKGN